MPESNRSARPEAAATRWFGAALAVLLAGLHFGLATSAARIASSTFDEGLHITSGMANLLTGDLRLHSGNGLLAQTWVALPLALPDAGFTFPNPDHIIGQQPVDDFHLLTHFLAHVFFYEVGNDPAAILAAARVQTALIGAALCLIVFLWARILWGTGPALLACGLCALSPNLLAHAGLATSDLMFAALLLATVGLVWQTFWQPRPVRILGAGIALGLLALTKTSAVGAVPIVGLLLVIRAFWPTPLPWPGRGSLDTPATRAAALAMFTLIQGAIAIAVIWTAYGFRYDVVPDGTIGHESMQTQWSWVHERKGVGIDTIDALRQFQILPEGFLFNAAFVWRQAEAGYASFFRGTSQIGGDWRFFPFAIGLKTPLALFPLLALAAIAAWRAPPQTRARTVRASAPLLVLIAVHGTIAVTSNINLGLRHVLPLYPALFILAGGAAWGLARANWLQQTAVAALGLAFAAASFSARPHYLANFNALIGPEQGYRVLVDSSLDWGQDLDELGRYLKDYPNKAELPVYLSYFGTADPTFHDLEVRLLPSFFDWPAILGQEATAPLDWTLEPGLYAISATMLQQTWSTVPREWGPGEARDYARLTAHFAPLEQAAEPAAALREALLDTPTRKRWLRYRQLRLTRLCQILREREPDSSVGHSILLYRVTSEDLARIQPPPTLPAPRSG